MIASMGRLGSVLGGGILASISAFPIVLVGSFLFWLMPALGYWFYGVGLIAGTSIIWAALRVVAPYDSSEIVLDSVMGMSLAFGGTVLRFREWKLYLCLFVLYHLLEFAGSYVARRQCIACMQPQQFLGVLLPDLLSGMCVHALLWVYSWWFI